jgi:hypothetical protein
MQATHRAALRVACCVALAIAAALPFLRAGENHQPDPVITPGSTYVAAERGAGQHPRYVLPTRSFDEAKLAIDPAVFQPLGAKSYHILRLDEARPPGDALEHVERLLPRSRAGDPRATFDIYLSIFDCRIYIRGNPGMTYAAAAGGDVEAKALSKTERKLMECMSLAGNDSLWNEPWLSLAAEQGSVEAKLYYATDVDAVLGGASERLAHPEKIIAWKERAKAYLEEAAGTGNLDAIAQLSNVYNSGILVERSAEAAYAYALAANRIDPNEYRDELLHLMEKELSMKQRETAGAQSLHIHASCCTP